MASAVKLTEVEFFFEGVMVWVWGHVDGSFVMLVNEEVGDKVGSIVESGVGGRDGVGCGGTGIVGTFVGGLGYTI